MGNAKNRGTFEERRSSALIRDKEMIAERERQECEVVLTPEQREQKQRNDMNMSYVARLMAMFGNIYGRR